MSEQILLGPQKQTGKECRVFERQACEVTTACRPAAAFNSKEAVWSATIRDVSAGGVRLVLRRRFETGTGLAIELPGNDDTYGASPGRARQAGRQRRLVARLQVRQRAERD